MNMPSWPDELVRPLVDGYQQQRGETRRMMRAEQGPPMVRRGMSKSVQTVPMAFYASRDQQARFDRFYIEECEDGALPFLMPAWGADGNDLLTADGLNLLTDEGVPMLISATWVCLFGQSSPNVTPMGLEWRISFDAVILP